MADGQHFPANYRGFIVPLGQIAHSIALDTTGDGTVDKVVPIEDKDKYIVGEDA